MSRTFIVAINSSQFLEHCRMNMLKPGPELQYISRPSAMDRVAVEDKIEFLPGAEERADYATMMDKYHVWVTRRTGSPTPKRYIVALDSRQFAMYCHDQGVNPHGREVEYISSPDKLRGLSQGTITFLEGADQRADYPDMVEYARQVFDLTDVTVEHDVPLVAR